MATEHFDTGHLLAGGGGDIQEVYQTAVGGRVLYWKDGGLGPVFFKLCQNRSGSAMAHGELVSNPGGNPGVASISNIDSGSTTHATKAAGFTANQNEGAVCWVMDNASSAGAAPENEMALIMRNTADVLTFDDRFPPLTAALEVSDDLEIDYNWQIEDAAQSDTASTVQGVVARKDGIPDTYFGWVQFFGKCRALTVSAAIAIDQPLEAGAARLAAIASGGSQTGAVIVGKSRSTIKADSVSDFALVFIACGDHTMGNVGTLDVVA